MRLSVINRHVTKRYRTGAAAVEFAIVAPLFLLLLAGIIEFGQAFRVMHTLTAASRHGARAASIQGLTSTQVIQRVQGHCTKALGGNATDITVFISVNGKETIDLGLTKKGDEIAVTAVIPLSKAGIGFYRTMLASRSLSSTCIIEKE
jgi:Flp pilus assembly protein TadG